MQSFVIVVYDVATKLPKDGVGLKLRRKHWPVDSYWLLTQVKLSVKQSVVSAVSQYLVDAGIAVMPPLYDSQV